MGAAPRPRLSSRSQHRLGPGLSGPEDRVLGSVHVFSHFCTHWLHGVFTFQRLINFPRATAARGMAFSEVRLGSAHSSGRGPQPEGSLGRSSFPGVTVQGCADSPPHPGHPLCQCFRWNAIPPPSSTLYPLVLAN